MWMLKLLTLLFLLGHCEPVAPANHDIIQSRHDRSSYYDHSYAPENSANPVDVLRHRRPTPLPQYQQYQQSSLLYPFQYQFQYQHQQHQQNQFEKQTQVLQQQQRQQTPLQPQEHGDNNDKSSLSKIIADLFEIGTGDGIKLFNNTYSPNHTALTHTSVDRSFINNQTIKVQRTPDGKLGWVLNNFLPFQNATEHLNNGGRSKYNTDFVFPDTDLQCEERIQTLCNKVRNYPDLSYLETLLEPELSKFEKFFVEDLIEPQGFKERMNYAPDEEPLCKSKEVINYPQSGETMDAIKMLILNTDKFKQGVRVELCENEGEPCKREFLGSLPNHYRSSCKQMYIYRQLVALTPDKKEVTTGLFKIPSCCKCVIKQLK